MRDVPPKYRSMYRRALAGRSRRAAIRAFCLECVGWSAAEVDGCTAPSCPLYRYRTGGLDAPGAMIATGAAQPAGEGDR